MGLTPGSLTPSLVGDLVRLGTAVPFGEAVQLLAHFRQVTVSAATVRRLTEGSGADLETMDSREVERLERTTPEPPAGPKVQQMSVDGAMVPLVGGAWAEVKTLAIGAVAKDGDGEPRASGLSYFSRMLDHERFGRLATVETHRRGTERAGVVCAVVDGAEWLQGFIDLHRRDAVRILDFPHAASHVVEAAQAVYGLGTKQTSEWVGKQLHALRHGGEEGVLEALRSLLATAAGEGATADQAQQTVTTSLSYLEKRREQLRYAAFHAQGYPIGSGIIESANKLVVEARLKGAGMHWSPDHVNPMLALRTLQCNGRWDEGWRRIQSWQRAQRHERAAERRQSRPSPSPLPAPPSPAASPTATVTAAPTPKAHLQGPLRPSANHPWRHMRLNPGRAPSTQPRPKT